MDQTTQFYVDQTMEFLGMDPIAQQTLQSAVAALTGIALRAEAGQSPSPETIARYCADKFVIDYVAATVTPEFTQLGNDIGANNPPPPPPSGL